MKPLLALGLFSAAASAQPQPVATEPTPTADGLVFPQGAAIPRSLTLYDVTDSGSLVAKSANVPPDSGPASLDIALDPSGRFLYRLRGLSVPTPGTPIVPQLDTYKVTGLDTNGGLDLVQTLTLPADLSTASVTGVIALDL